MSWRQIRDLGIPDSTRSRWLKDGYLHLRVPHVYAVGHAAATLEARLAEALLYAGPGAILSHTTAAWWLGLLDDEPKVIHVSTPRQCRSLKGIKVHPRRTLDRTWHNRLPTTALPQTFLDLAATCSLRLVRRALAAADYKGMLDLGAVEAIAGRGRRGATKLRLALARHRPELARTKSRLEAVFFEICEDEGWALPELNVPVGRWEVDAPWRDERVAVELDGYGNHHSPAQLKRDRRKEMALRRAGLIPVRYSYEQLTRHRQEVIADLRRLRPS